MGKLEKLSVDINRLGRSAVTAYLVGATPLILHRMSQKAMKELLLPGRKKNRMDREQTLKHDPIKEYRESAYLDPDPEAQTLLQHLGSAFKKAIAGAALDTPGAFKTQIGRLVVVPAERVSIYGIPKLHMSIVRSAGMNKTPDVRTRLIVPEWACSLDIHYANMKHTDICNLLVNAGITQGTGDGRVEKGALAFGQWDLVNHDDPEYVRRLAFGRATQRDALDNPVAYDAETDELLSWFADEARARGEETLPKKANGARRRQAPSLAAEAAE